MKKILYSLVFLSALGTHAVAQDPEFYLILRHYLNDQLWPHALYLGYDPSASDALEGPTSWFEEKGGEQELPPFFGSNDFRFTAQTVERDSTYGQGTRIDIRHKPDSASFQLTYELQMMASTDFQYATMRWANTAIPPIIHQMILEPATIAPGPARQKTDMKLVTEMLFPNRDSIDKYRLMLITLYYNRDYLSTVIDGKKAIKTLSILSNPVSQRLSALVYLQEPENVRVLLLDISGRVISQQTVRGETGVNPVDIDCSKLPNGAYKLVAFAGRNAFSQTVIVSK